MSLQIKEGNRKKEKIKIKAEKTNENQKLTWAPTILNVGKDDDVVISVMKKSKVISSKFDPRIHKNGKYQGNMQVFHSILPGLEVEYVVEDLLETIEKPDSGKNKTQKKNKFRFF